MPAPTCPKGKSPYYCAINPYNDAIHRAARSWLGQNYGEDRDFYVAGQNWVQS